MAKRIVVVALLAGGGLLLGAGVVNPPLDARVAALEARVAALEKQQDDLVAQLAAVLTRRWVATPAGGGPVPVPAAPLVDVRSSVKEVLDGATFVLLSGETVRLIGVDPSAAPREAEAQLRFLVAGQVVRLWFDAQQTDAQGRLLAYAAVGDRFVNADLIRLGFAKAVTAPPNVGYASEFLRLQREAQTHKRGLWAERKGS
jgi:endonuclease YncB( thermonuclease family)